MDRLTRSWFIGHVWVHRLTTAVAVQGSYCVVTIGDFFLGLLSAMNLCASPHHV